MTRAIKCYVNSTKYKEKKKKEVKLEKKKKMSAVLYLLEIEKKAFCIVSRKHTFKQLREK